MPLSLTKIVARTAECQFDFLDETVRLTYRPAAIQLSSPFEARALAQRIEREAEAAEQRGEDGVRHARRLLAERVCEVLVAWDVQEEDGTVVPITPARLTDIDAGFLGLCMETVQEDARLGKPTGTPSTGTPSPSPSARTSSRRKATGSSSKKPASTASR